MEVVVQDETKSITKKQRGWFHKMCALVSDETGYTEGEVKELVKKRVLGTRVVQLGDFSSEVSRSSEESGRENYSLLIEGLYQMAAEGGLALPQPDPEIKKKVLADRTKRMERLKENEETSAQVQ